MNRLAPSCQLRSATVEDTAAVHALLLASREQIGLTERFVNPQYIQWVASECSKGNVLIATTEGLEVAGAMILDGDELAYLVVSPRCRKHGIGTQLLEHAKTMRESVITETLMSNETMQKALRANGFSPCDRRKTDNMCSFIWQR
jgi:N-acetylglutamate synthase-like GNAT family acetyltransferase